MLLITQHRIVRFTTAARRLFDSSRWRLNRWCQFACDSSSRYGHALGANADLFACGSRFSADNCRAVGGHRHHVDLDKSLIGQYAPDLQDGVTSPRMKPTGSVDAASRLVASSSVRKGILSAATCPTRVVLPDCRGPDTITTLVSDSAAWIRFLRKRGYIRTSLGDGRFRIKDRPIESQRRTI